MLKGEQKFHVDNRDRSLTFMSKFLELKSNMISNYEDIALAVWMQSMVDRRKFLWIQTKNSNYHHRDEMQGKEFCQILYQYTISLVKTCGLS